MSFYKKYTNNSYFFSMLKKAIVTVCSVVFVSILSRYLGPELKGEYSAFMSYSSIAVIVMQMGFFKLYPSYKRSHLENNCKDIFFSISIYKFLFFLIVLSLYIFLTDVSRIYVVFMLVVLLNMLQGECLFLTLIDNIKYQNIISIVVYALNMIYILMLYLIAAPSVIYVFWVLIISDLITVFLCVKFINYRIIFSLDIIHIMRKLIKKSLYPIVAALLVEINYRVDVIFLNMMVDNYYVGLYASGVTVAEMAWMIPDVFKEVLFNKTATSDNPKEVCFSLRISIFIVISCLLGLIVFGETLIRIFFGDAYIDAYLVTLLIVIGVPFMAMFKVLNPLIQARGEWGYYISMLFMAAVSNVVFNIIMIKTWGMYGAAISSIISYAIAGIGLLIYFRKTFDIKYLDCLMIKKDDIKKIYNFIV